jgi:hypothetical protein
MKYPYGLLDRLKDYIWHDYRTHDGGQWRSCSSFVNSGCLSDHLIDITEGGDKHYDIELHVGEFSGGSATWYLGHASSLSAAKKKCVALVPHYFKQLAEDLEKELKSRE